MMHTMYSWGGGWMMVIWWLIIAAGVIALVKWLPSLSGPTEDGKYNAMEELRRRYANSEIDEEEFQRKKHILQDN